MSTLYISGPMSGYPDLNHPAFFAAADLLVAGGYDVLNPAAHEADGDKTWVDWLRLDLFDVLAADGVAVLPSWACSRGAQLEVYVAQQLGVPVKPLDGWLS